MQLSPHPTIAEAQSRMIQALGLEVAAIRRKGGGKQVELRGGERVAQIAGSWLYKFVVPGEPVLRDETPVRVTCGQDDVSGVLVSFREGVLVVALEKDLGPKIASARLTTDDSFLVERLKEKLEKIQDGGLQFNLEAGARVLGFIAVNTAEADPDASVLRGDGSCLNDDQLRAVRFSLGSDTTYVWGPPGTGKTTTLARIVEAHYRAGRSVLLVSNTNIAVDTALEKVAERLQRASEFHQGLVIRQGPVVKPELRERFGKQVILEEIVARLGETLRKRRDKLTAEEATLLNEQRALAKAKDELERFMAKQRILRDCRDSLEASRSELDARKIEVDDHGTRAASLRSDLQRAQGMGSVRRLFSGLNVERIQRELAAEDRTVQSAQEAARALANDIAKLEDKIPKLEREIKTRAPELRSYPALPEIEKDLATIRSRLKDTGKQIQSIDKQLSEIEQDVLEHCRILATTVYRTYLGKEASRRFDVVVVDEASMLMPPLVFYVAGLSQWAVTVAGDFRQLPPIVMSNDQLAVKWLKRDVFETAGIPGQIARSQPTPQLVALGTQYRMREPICEVVNHIFYADRPLLSQPSDSPGDPQFPFGPAPLMYVDTASFNPWAALQVGTYSRYNLFHALLVRNLVLHLADTGFLPTDGRPNDAVGAVSPYASQARLIQSLLEDKLKARAAGIAATVHRFQGNEKAAMVLDLTDSFGVRLGRFLKATSVQEDGARLLNVAASRARFHVVLVGNFKFLLNKAPHNAIVRRLIDHFQKHGQSLDAEDLLPLGQEDWVDGIHCMVPPSFEWPEQGAGVFSEGTFYPAFLNDLARAKESIVIMSPFATQTGTSRWVDSIRAAQAKGVRIRILTRPAGEFGGGSSAEVAELVTELRRLNIVVDLRAKMHEKVAILDGHILWHGSLNILSHSNTHESMLRIDSKIACEQLGRFVTSPTRGRDSLAVIDQEENPQCPECGRTTIWINGRYGVFFKCEDPQCTGEIDLRRKGAENHRTRQKANDGTTGRPCPAKGCNGRLVARNGRYGKFLGCSQYPRCRHTENIN